MFWKIVNVWYHHNDFSSNFSCISEEQRLFVVKNKTGKRQGKRCKRKLTIYKDFCASLEAVFLTQGSVPHSASKRSSIVVFGRHHIQNGSGGLVFILSPRIRFFYKYYSEKKYEYVYEVWKLPQNSGVQHLRVAQFVPLDLRRGWSANRIASQVEGSALGGSRIGRAYGGRRRLK